MTSHNIITNIDIGSSKIRTLIGYFDEDNNENFHILGLGISASNAIRKGNILDMEEFKNNLDKSLEEAEKMAGEQVSGAYLSFNSSSIEVVKNRGIVAISGNEISNDDIERSLDMAKSGIDSSNKEIIKVIPESFVVDLEEGVKNPIGMSARKLEVIVNIFLINTNVLNNIKKAVSDVGIEIYDIFPNLLASPEGVLTKRQKELGVVCIDIGTSTTGITVFEGGTLRYSSVIPIGGDNVTNDIALGLRTSTVIAEKLKLELAELSLGKEEGYKDKEIDLSKEVGEELIVSKVYLSDIVTARYEEIFSYIKEELKKIGKDGMLPEGAVCVGGGVKIKGFIELGKNELRLPVFIGIPVPKDELIESSINDPVFAAVVGAMIMSNKFGGNGKSFSINIGGFFVSIVNIFKKLLP
ncbi:cell division protein FtsA [Candidatus Gracilibacteria bacterium]|nr:MAG: cell division protein FtsA [Candidatus Gracilibacteria bacterium]